MLGGDEMYDSFVGTVGAYYRQHGRHDLPWRLPDAGGVFDPYKILVSEVMLQQTQVPRVVPKFQAFLEHFPTMQSLAAASLGDILVAWQGLGYNRRAKYLWQAARIMSDVYDGTVPNNQTVLEDLPGIGANTAAAIRAYAFDEPVVFIETNIRAVFIHHFFPGVLRVSDREIAFFVDKALNAWLGKEQEQPRQRRDPDLFRKRRREKPSGLSRVFYWALMDYGTFVKASVGNTARASTSYTRQSTFSGSLRQIRGQVLRILAGGPQEKAALLAMVPDPRAPEVVEALIGEGLVYQEGARIRLP